MGARQKIPQEELDRIKREVSVADLARRRGVELAPHGKDLIGLCPFHNDHEPSLVITPDKNLWHCLGACQAGGDVIEWVMKAEGASFRHAVELLRRADVGLAPLSRPSTAKYSTVKKLPTPFETTADDRDILRRVVDFYHETLKESPEALAYLDKRKIGHAGAVDHFKLGYANRTLGYRLPFANRHAGADLRGRLMRFGIYRASGHEHFAGSLVIPVIDEEGDVTEVYGRKIGDSLRTGTPLHLYLPGPHKGVWNISPLAVAGEVILCEALIDALTFWCAGFRNVTASYGVEGFTSDHLAAFKKCGIQNVFIAYDRDDAGDRAAAKLADRLMTEGFDCFRVEFPLNHDANDFARTSSDPADALGTLLRGALWLGKGQRPAMTTPAAAEIQPPAAKEKETPPDDLPLAAPEELAAVDPMIPAAPDATGAEPPAALKEPPASANDGIELKFDDREWRVRGIEKNLTLLQLRVHVRVRRGERYHLDTFDLHLSRFREIFIRTAAREIGAREETIKTDLGHVLRRVEEVQDELIRKLTEPKDPAPILSDEERAEALEFLKRPDILTRLAADFAAVGHVGEETNALVGYLAAVSRKLDPPLSLIIQSSTAAGKSTLMDAILSFVPKEDYVKYTAVTGQSLFYMSETNLKQKIIAIAEEKGAERAGYALKLLQSECRLTIAATGKDPKTGKLVTHEYHVEGPAAIFITTTNVEIDEEVLNRALVLTVNEDREQTRRIHDLQRESQTLDGMLRRQERAEILRRHQNAQRLLKPILVVNPYARELTFLDTRLRMRRDHMKYLTLIRAVTLLHQHQRPIRHTDYKGRSISYIESTLDDIETANRLAHAVLGRTLDDMAPQTRRLLILIDQLVDTESRHERLARSEIRFSRRSVREFCGWSDTALKVHLRRLEELEYLLIHRAARGQSFVYELLYDDQGKDGNPFFMGLIDADTLRNGKSHQYDSDRSGQNTRRSGSGQPLVSPRSGGGQAVDSAATSTTPSASTTLLKNRAKTHIRGHAPRSRRSRMRASKPLAAKK